MDIPSVRIGNPELLSIISYSHLTSIGILDDVLDLVGCSLRSLNVYLDIHDCFFVRYCRCRHICSLPGHMHQTCCHHPDIAVDTTARIPARVRLLRIVNTYSNDVILALRTEERRDIIAEGAVSIWPRPHLLSIHIDGTIHIDTVKFDEYPFSRRSYEMLTIPSDTPWQGTTPDTSRMLVGELSFNRPVVRQMQPAPSTIIE